MDDNGPNLRNDVENLPLSNGYEQLIPLEVPERLGGENPQPFNVGNEQWDPFEPADEETYFQLQVANEAVGFQKLLAWDDDLMYKRVDECRWIIDTRKSCGLSFEAAYLAISYFDRFLSIVRLEEMSIWKLLILSISCLSIASKTQNVSFKAGDIPQTILFGSAVKRMEFLVLDTLKWQTNLVTPFCYLHYLARQLMPDSIPEDVVAVSKELCLTFTEVKLQVDLRPSAIAIASIFVGAGEVLTIDQLANRLEAVSFRRALDIDAVFATYHLMHEWNVWMTSAPRFQFSPTSVLANHRR